MMTGQSKSGRKREEKTMIPFNAASIADLEIERVVDAMKNSKLSGCFF